MRITRGQRENQSRTGRGRIALVAVSACALGMGCQGPQLDHVDGSSASFNASQMPAADRNPSVAATGSQTAAPSSTSLPKSTEPASALPASTVTTEAQIVENLNLGHREAALNRLDQAEVYYRRVLDVQPENSIANHRLAVLADKRRDFARAEHYYLTALRHDSQNADLLGDLGYSYLLQGRAEESERYLLAATRLDPSHSKALHNLSLLYAMSGDYDRSFDALRRAVGETEARVKIVRLFPNGRPPASKGDEVIASFQPSQAPESSASAAVEEPVGGTPANGPQPTTPPSLTEPVPISGPTTAPPFESADAVSTTPPPAVAHTPTGRASDNQINDLFSAIDREVPDHPPAAPAASSLPTGSDARPPAATPPSSAEAWGAGNASDAPELQAAPGADPLGAMPLWSPAASAPSDRKPPAAFMIDDGQPLAKAPRVVATGILPAAANAAGPGAARRADGLSELETESSSGKGTIAEGHTQSNAGPVRQPLMTAGPLPGGLDGSSNPGGRAGGDGNWPAPFENAPPLHIQPRNNSAPLFEPVEGFGPANDFAPADKVGVPAWPATNGNAAPPMGDAGDSGPVIRPRSDN